MNLRWSFWRAESGRNRWRCRLRGSGGVVAQLQVPAGDGAARPLTRPSGTLSPGGRGGIAVESLMFLEDCTRTEPAIFAIYVQCSKQSFDSPCNLRTSHVVHRAIFAPPAAGRREAVRVGSSPALILMVLPIWLGRSLDRNGSGTHTLDCKVISFLGRGTGFRFVPYQKEVL
jgi:hypothetical protein